MKKKIILLVLAVPILFGAFKVTERVTFKREAWLADFEQLKTEIEHNYANLKWAAPVKGVDFVALNESATNALQQSKSPAEARAALAAFIGGFDDGHFHIESGPPRPIAAIANLWPKRTGAPRIEFDMSAPDVCSAFGFGEKPHALGFEHPRVVPQNGRTFASGVLTLQDGRKFGVIRIPLFQHREYGAACERAWDQFRGGHTGTCDEECQDDFLHHARREVAADLAADARALQQVARDGLIIDLTGNGGGTEWAEYAAFALTRASLKPPAVAFVRGQHWARVFEEDARELPAADRPIAAAMLDSARVQCQLGRIWSDASFEPACWNSVPKAEYPSQDYTAELHQAQPYDGPLYIMIDENTASASELFIAMLKDAGAATLIGTRTAGAGCGYTNGGIDIELRNSGLKIAMPDCARLRRDGSNEYGGIAADVIVDWKTGMGQSLEAALARLR